MASPSGPSSRPATRSVATNPGATDATAMPRGQGDGQGLAQCVERGLGGSVGGVVGFAAERAAGADVDDAALAAGSDHAVGDAVAQVGGAEEVHVDGAPPGLLPVLP
ncbi:hypothetical protein Slala05_06370 [Streptomyces lavendulae subsp. lavendulae]|nr:hypothetical protein Slala05_06370 [Streptomyces lavendulae subsp. lavendulae]